MAENKIITFNPNVENHQARVGVDMQSGIIQIPMFLMAKLSRKAFDRRTPIDRFLEEELERIASR